MKDQNSEFLPDYAVAPGGTITETLDALGLGEAEVARRSGLAPEAIHRVIEGRAPVTGRLALALDEMTGVPAHFWERYEALYQDSLSRIAGSTDTTGAADLFDDASP